MQPELNHWKSGSESKLDQTTFIRSHQSSSATEKDASLQWVFPYEIKTVLKHIIQSENDTNIKYFNALFIIVRGLGEPECFQESHGEVVFNHLNLISSFIVEHRCVFEENQWRLQGKFISL